MSCRSHSGRGGRTRTFWLFLPPFSLRASARLDPRRRQGQDLASRPTLDNGGGSALPCTPSTSWQRGPYVPGRPTPSLPRPGACHAFVRSLPLRDRGSEPVGGRDARPLPGELNSDTKGTQKAHCAKGMEEALSLRSAWPRRYSEVGKSRNKTTRTRSTR